MSTNIIKKTAAEWATANPVLNDFQTGAEIDTRRTKTGNGSTPWISLDYNGDDVDTPSFIPANGIKLDNIAGNIYNTYTQSGALTITVVAGSIVGAGVILPIIVDGTTITISGATIDPKSDTASTTATDVDRYVFWKDTLGVYYSITNMG